MSVSGTEDEHFERKFGHCLITWRIASFSLAGCVENTVIQGPEFKIRGRYSTRWRPTITTMIKCDDDYSMSLRLERLEPDDGPDIVWADIRLCLVDRDKAPFSEVSCNYYFDKKSKLNLNLQSMTPIFEKYPFTNDMLTVKCQILVHPEDQVKRLESIGDLGISILSQDLKMLYKTSKCYDLYINVQRKDTMKAHKAILYSRCPILAKAIESIERGRTLQINKVNADTLDKMLSFLYTGSYEDIYNRPSIQIYEAAIALNLHDIKAYYYADEYAIHTTVDASEYVFVWLITNYNGRNEECLVSPPFNKGLSEDVWRLKLYLWGVDDNVDYLSLFAELVEGGRPQSVCLDFAIVDAKGESFFQKRLRTFLNENGVLGFADFVKRDDLERTSLVSNNTLRIGVKVRSLLPSVAFKSNLVSSMISLMAFPDKEQSYKNLSNDMEQMFHHGPFRDINLIAEDMTFKVHKFVLCARSWVLSNLIYSLPNNERTLRIANMRPHTLRMFLFYLYCGRLPNYTPKDLIELYKAADTYDVPSLKVTCSRILQSSHTVENVMETLSFAKSKRDVDLIASCFGFIRDNKGAFGQPSSWRIWPMTE